MLQAYDKDKLDMVLDKVCAGMTADEIRAMDSAKFLEAVDGAGLLQNDGKSMQSAVADYAEIRPYMPLPLPQEQLDAFRETVLNGQVLALLETKGLLSHFLGPLVTTLFHQDMGKLGLDDYDIPARSWQAIGQAGLVVFALGVLLSTQLDDAMAAIAALGFDKTKEGQSA